MLESISKEEYGEGYEAALLEQWKTCVEQADSNTVKRNNSNGLFISLNVGLFAAITFAWDYKSILLSRVGIVVWVLWLNMIRSYQKLSRVKYDMINEIEKRLPLAPLAYKWEKLNREHNYVVVLDISISGGGEALTDHIKGQLNNCTDIIVVMSEATKNSWWVPFEIGMAAQIAMPTASYLTSSVSLPDYLEYWPRLKSVSDVATYVSGRRDVADRLQWSYPFSYSQSTYRPIETAAFYDEVERKLR